MIYVGTDDGLLQVTEDGGKHWRKVEDFPGVPKWTYVSDISPRRATRIVVFVAFNNWQRGDYRPYLLKSYRSRPDVQRDPGESAGPAATSGRSSRIT